MKKKSLLSLLLALSLIISTMIPVKAEGKTMAGWSELLSTGDGTTTVVAPSEDAARTGDLSLSVTFQAGTTGYREYIQNTLAEVTLKAGVEYEIGYWYQYFTDHPGGLLQPWMIPLITKKRSVVKNVKRIHYTS